MTDRSKLLALAEAVEKLTGPDREVDARIAHAIKWRWDGWEEGDVCIERYTEDAIIDRVHKSNSSIWRHLPVYTASLDAAMTLVPEGFVDWELSGDGGTWVGDFTCFNNEQNEDKWRLYVRAATPALALTAAALRAQAEALS